MRPGAGDRDETAMNEQTPRAAAPGVTALAALNADDFGAVVRASLSRDAGPAVWNARRRNQEALERLARTVTAHRDKILSGDGGEDDDETLWGCLDQITAATASGGEMPLGKWLDWLDEVREARE